MSFDFGSGLAAAVTVFVQSGFNPYAAAVAFVVGGLAGGDAKRSARNKARSAFNDAQRDRDQMIQSATAPHKIVYGRAKVSGPIAYAQSTGAKGEFLHLIVMLAGHEIDAVETVYLNDQPIALDGAGNVTTPEYIRTVYATALQGVTASGSATTVATLANTPTRVLSVVAPDQTSFEGVGATAPLTWSLAGAVITINNGATTAPGAAITVTYEYVVSATPLVRVKSYLGTSTQTADTGLIADSGGKWTSAHRLRGLAYLYIKIEYDQDVFGAVGLPDFSAVVRGHKVWDPRAGTTAWRENAALCTAHYLRNYMGATAAEVPDAELTVEANCSDELVTTATGVTEARYTCNGVLSTDQSPRDNLDALAEAMAGTVTWAQGRYIVRAGRHLATELTITESMLAAGAITIQPDAQRTELYNRVVAKYVEPAKAWTTIEAPPVTNATYVADDGGLDLPMDVTLDMVTGAMRAQRLAKIMLERNRQGMRVQLKTNLMAYDVVPGSVVALTLARYGWSAKQFTVTDRAHDFAEGTVALTLRETAATVWDWAFGAATTVDLTPNTSLPNALARPAALASLAAVSGAAWLQKLGDGTIQCRANVTWTQSTDMAVVRGGRVEVQWCRADTANWVQAAPLAGDAASTVIGPLEEDKVINVRVRAVSSLGRAGAWSYVSHAPTGKSAAPANVGGFAATVVQGGVTIVWNASEEADYAFTELRRGASWAAGTALDGSAAATKPTRVTGTYYHWAWPNAGSYTLWAAHRDASGNISSVPVSFAVTIGNNGLVQTVGVAPNAATDVVAVSSGAGSLSLGPAAGSLNNVVASGGYTNSTGASLLVTITWNPVGVSISQPSSSDAGELWWSYTSSVTGTVGSRLMQTAVAAGTFQFPSVMRSLSLTLAAGETITFETRCVLSKSSSSGTLSATWTDINMRLEGIKR